MDDSDAHESRCGQIMHECVNWPLLLTIVVGMFVIAGVTVLVVRLAVDCWHRLLAIRFFVIKKATQAEPTRDVR